MKIFTLDKIKDCSSIFSNGNYVILSGKSTQIFDRTGILVVNFKTFRYIQKAVFFQDNTVLIDSPYNGFYHHVSLNDGNIIWSSVQKGRRTCLASNFVVSSNGSTVYDICSVGYQKQQIDRICPQEQLHDRYIISDGLRVTDDIFCDTDGAFCVLQSHLIVNKSEEYYYDNTPPIQQNGILAISYSPDGPRHEWRRLWKSDNYIRFRACDGKHLLCENFDVVNMETGETFNLLENDTRSFLPKHYSFTWSYDKENHFLSVFFVGELFNIVIDCKARKRVAQYKRTSQNTGYQGCIIGDEYWMGTDNGVVRKPFPYMEDI